MKHRSLAPVAADLLIERWVHDETDRKIVVRATCHAGGTLTAEAEALFIAVNFEEVRARMRERHS